VLTALLQQTPEARRLRKDTTWLLLPIEDPDGSADAAFDRLTDLFLEAPDDEAMSPEVFAYARYFTKYIYDGRAVHVAVSLHNVEANETEQVMCPFITLRDKPPALLFNQAFFQALTARGFVTGDPQRPWAYGFTPFRLFGWCAEQFGAFTLAYEVNDRYPAARLSLNRQQEIGAILADAISAWLTTPEGKLVCARADQLARLKRLERAVHYTQVDHNPDERTGVELITRGF